MRVAYFDTFSGISGDMTIGAFLDAALPMKALSDGLKRLGLGGYRLKKTKVRRGPIVGTKFDCIAEDSSHNHRSLRQVMRLIDKSRLNDRVKSLSKQIFANIGQAEAKVHGIAKGRDVSLHELGQIDSIVDIVGTAIAIDALKIEKVYASNLTMGRTSVVTRHGVIPVPAPAALELLKGVPVGISELKEEVVTPTGAGILTTLSKDFGPMPAMKISRIGYGAGTKEFDGMPNMLRLLIGQLDASFKEDSVTIIETNIDDMNPQYFEYLFSKLFEGGALDAYVATIQMKKTRPAFKLSVICRPKDLNAMASVIFRETTSMGIRFYEAGRYILNRRVSNVMTDYGRVRIKISESPGKGMTASPEYDDCVRIASKKDIALKDVYEAVRKAAITIKRKSDKV